MTIVAINRELRAAAFYTAERQEPNLMQWLDLVALGTVCDVVPLKGLNRAYVRQGLKIMGNRNNLGLTALIDKAGITSAPSAFHLGYVWDRVLTPAAVWAKRIWDINCYVPKTAIRPS